MNPGRDLDSLIEQAVFGNKVRHSKAWPGHMQYLTGNDILKPYSTDISAAWEVVGKLISIGYLVDIQTHTRFHQVQLDKLIGKTDNGGIWQGGESIDGESAPHAICLAALKAVGMKL